MYFKLARNEFFDFSANFYNNYNKKYGLKSYNDLKLYRLFNSYEEQNNWIGKTSFEPYKSILNHQNSSIEKIQVHLAMEKLRNVGSSML